MLSLIWTHSLLSVKHEHLSAALVASIVALITANVGMGVDYHTMCGGCGAPLFAGKYPRGQNSDMGGVNFCLRDRGFS